MKKRLTMRWIATAAAGMTVLSGMAMNTFADVPEDIWEYVQLEDEDDNIIYDFKEVEVAVPQDWEGKYEFEISEKLDGTGSSVTFYHPASRKAREKELGYKNEGGVLFSVCYSENYDFLDVLPSYQIIGSGEKGVYYLMFPTDVQGYLDGGEIWDEWGTLVDDYGWIEARAQMIAPGEGIVDMNQIEGEDALQPNNSSGSYGEYIVADSSDRELSASDLMGFNADQLQMAINEIYARHGRKFETKSIQKYFDEKSWYSGTIAADKFDPATLSLTEGKNIALMLDCMKSAGTESTSGSQSTGAGTSDSGLSGQSSVVSGTQMMATTTVNIRSKASTSGSIMGVVPQGYVVTVTGSENDGWIPVSYNGIRGYMSRQYLTTEIDAGAVTQPQTNAPSQQQNDGQSQTNEQPQTDAQTQQQTEVPQIENSQPQSDIGLNLYVGTYESDSYYTWEDEPYYQMAISWVTDTSFGFIINKMDSETEQVIKTLANGTAQRTEDGTAAYCETTEYSLSFTFPDYHSSYPDVTDVVVSGIPEIEGVGLANNNVPGHEFS